MHTEFWSGSFLDDQGGNKSVIFIGILGKMGCEINRIGIIVLNLRVILARR
jgi:hypothetical protein